MASIFDVGSSALNSLQRAISTTGNNIANVNTEGYSRQQVEFSSRTPDYIGGLALGTGVEVSAIRRAYDQFLTADVQARRARRLTTICMRGLLSKSTISWQTLQPVLHRQWISFLLQWKRLPTARLLSRSVK